MPCLLHFSRFDFEIACPVRPGASLYKICLTNAMEHWDRLASRRLNAAVEEFTVSGVVRLLNEQARETWRANLARHEPAELGDDAGTLGYLSSRNLANRVFDRMARRGELAGRALARHESNTVVVCVADFALHLVKVPGASRRQPRWVADFDWATRETRLAAARRNADAYQSGSLRPDTEPLFEIDRRDGSEGASGCRDVFLVWAGDAQLGLTAGWLGLPTTGASSWLAVQPLWWDEVPSGAEVASTRGNGSGDTGFRDRELPRPTMALKPRLSREVTR